ncbi:MAG: heavy-metal-associated domain-containing protein [Gammaproteobacteria bacterium]
MHIDNKLGESGRRNVEQTLTSARGVIRARFNERRPHLMLVSYDTESTSSFEILAQVAGQRLGVERCG